MSEVINDFLSAIKEAGIVINFLQVRQNDEVIADYGRLESKVRLNTWSVAKSFTSVGVGIAVDEGLVTVDDYVCDYFKEYVPKGASENLLSLQLKHLLTMTTGLKEALFFGSDPKRYETKDWISYFFNAEFTLPPNQQFLYSNFNTYMASCMVEKKAGMNMMDYMRPKLFEPINIFSPDSTFCPMGHMHAANNMYMTIDELGNFGELLLHKGEFRGKRIVSEAYLEEATKNHVSHLNMSSVKNGYGYQFWTNPDNKSFRADGKYGQYICVIPDKKAVIAIQAIDEKPVFPLLWKHIAEKL